MADALIFHDFAKRLVQPGDHLVYAALGGRSALLKCGIAIRVQAGKSGMYGEQPGPRLLAITLDLWPDYPVIDPVTRKTAGRADRWDLQNNGKPVTLSFPSRVLVVNPNQIPPEPRQLLADAWKAWLATESPVS
jgi:hypothetical protein